MKKILVFLICLFLITSNTTTAHAATSNTFNLANNNINVNGNFDDWNSVPSSYEYNWDNSDNCWNQGVWVDGVCYKTEQGKYSTDVRHKVQMHTDGENVYLHIVFSRDYEAGFNGEDYQLSVDGNTASFQIEFLEGGTVTNNLDNLEPGVHEVAVKHANSSLSSTSVEGAKAYLKTNDNNVNNEIEIAIPIKSLEQQNSSINSDNISVVSFYNPNLMYRDVAVAGTSSGPYILMIICTGIVVITTYLFLKRKNAIQIQF